MVAVGTSHDPHSHFLLLSFCPSKFLFFLSPLPFIEKRVRERLFGQWMKNNPSKNGSTSYFQLAVNMIGENEKRDKVRESKHITGHEIGNEG